MCVCLCCGLASSTLVGTSHSLVFVRAAELSKSRQQRTHDETGNEGTGGRNQRYQQQQRSQWHEMGKQHQHGQQKRKPTIEFNSKTKKEEIRLWERTSHQHVEAADQRTVCITGRLRADIHDRGLRLLHVTICLPFFVLNLIPIYSLTLCACVCMCVSVQVSAVLRH